MKIVFMGTPEFAVPSLDILVSSGFDIVGVITATDKPAGRGNKIKMSAVKQYALEKGLPILQPKNLKSPVFLEELAALKADLQVVVAFRMLPAVVFDMPPLGTINLHGSLLPNYRGAAPINWAVMNGETETGVTTFFIQQQIDTGKIIFQEDMPIGPKETAGEVHDRMMILGAGTVLKTVKSIESGTYPSVAQQLTGDEKPAHKIHKSTCLIDWSKEVQSIFNHVRGLYPYPTAHSLLDGETFKILETDYSEEAHELAFGTMVSDGKTYLKVAAKGGFLHLLKAQLPGRRRMPIADLLRGYKGDFNGMVLS